MGAIMFAGDSPNTKSLNFRVCCTLVDYWSGQVDKPELNPEDFKIRHDPDTWEAREGCYSIPDYLVQAADEVVPLLFSPDWLPDWWEYNRKLITQLDWDVARGFLKYAALSKSDIVGSF